MVWQGFCTPRLFISIQAGAEDMLHDRPKACAGLNPGTAGFLCPLFSLGVGLNNTELDNQGTSLFIRGESILWCACSERVLVRFHELPGLLYRHRIFLLMQHLDPVVYQGRWPCGAAGTRRAATGYHSGYQLQGCSIRIRPAHTGQLSYEQALAPDARLVWCASRNAGSPGCCASGPFDFSCILMPLDTTGNPYIMASR